MTSTKIGLVVIGTAAPDPLFETTDVLFEVIIECMSENGKGLRVDYSIKFALQ